MPRADGGAVAAYICGVPRGPKPGRCAGGLLPGTVEPTVILEPPAYDGVVYPREVRQVSVALKVHVPAMNDLVYGCQFCATDCGKKESWCW